MLLKHQHRIKFSSIVGGLSDTLEGADMAERFAVCVIPPDNHATARSARVGAGTTIKTCNDGKFRLGTKAAYRHAAEGDIALLAREEERARARFRQSEVGLWDQVPLWAVDT